MSQNLLRIILLNCQQVDSDVTCKMPILNRSSFHGRWVVEGIIDFTWVHDKNQTVMAVIPAVTCW